MATMTQTEISARKWVDSLVSEYGLKKAIELMRYNMSGKNEYFTRVSNDFVTYAWQRFNELNPS